MFSGKNQASQHPTAFGSMLQASTYGVVIPVGYGLAQSPLYAIWAANLRQGGSTKKFKQMKKGVTSYCENIDFLLGKNPIQGTRRMWNNGALLNLNFTSWSTAITSGGAAEIDIPDSHFDGVIAVTLLLPYSVTFNDYGGPGSSSLSGNYEVPLWNELFAGPDPTDSSVYRAFPFGYRWEPSYGAKIYLDHLPTGAMPSGTLKIYYTQLTSATKYQPPAARLKLSFEAELGNGDEYDGFTDEQIVYPWYAGLGSSEIDLGSAGAIPSIKAETQFKWGVYPSGDADYVDIIEDILKSGIAQASIGGALNFGATEHGTASYNFPGAIQKKQATGGSAGLPPMLYDMPNTPGSILVTIATGQASLAISSTAGDVWTPVLGGSPKYQVWYATAVGGPNTVNISGGGEPSTAVILEIGGPGNAQIAIDRSTSVFPGDVSNAHGVITKNFSSPLGPYFIEGLWDNFEMIQPLPSDAVIQGLYATAVYSVSPNHCAAVVGTGYGLTPTDGISNPSIGGSLGTLLGTSLAALAGLGVGAVLSASTPLLPLPPVYSPADEIDVSAVGVAVYYTSATPVIDSTIPPPFTVPPGQGVAWAVPSRFRQGGYLTNTDGWLQQALGSAASWAPATVVTSDTPIITVESDGSFSVAAGGSPTGRGSVPSTVQPGLPGFLLAIPFYGGSDAPPGSAVAQWDRMTPANFYGNAPETFLAHGRIIGNPGSFAFSAPGNATSLVALSIKYLTAPTNAKAQGDFLDPDTRELTRAQCRANGLWGSLVMTAQKPASDWIKDLCDAADCWPVYSGFRLKLAPRSEVSAVGNGAIYNAPTAGGPVADLDVDNGDFIAAKGEPAIKMVLKSRTDTDTVLQMQHLNRASAYQQVTTVEPDAAGIAIYGVRKKDPITNNAVQDTAIARSILQIMVWRRNYVETVGYSFKLNARWQHLDVPDLVTITDRSQGIVKMPVRLIDLEESDAYENQCDAEPFVWGIHAPRSLPAPTSNPYSGGGEVNASAGNVNTPLIFEPVPRLCALAPQAQLWLVVSSPSPNYGGCQVFVSTDGGASYNPVGDPIAGSAITGVLTADWPGAADPDTANDLAVDLTECLGTLESFATTDEDNFVYPCYVQGAPIDISSNGTLEAAIPLTAILSNDSLVVGNFGYELMTYANAVLTAANKYTLKATGAGNKLRRAVFNAPAAGNGCDHPLGARWAFLSPAGTGIVKLNMDPVWVGHQLFFKICSFNTFGAAAQSLSDVPAYTYTPTGVPYL
jgi:Putative phage tail protein